jgi:hypothetical protein
MANELQSRSAYWRNNHYFYDETVGGGQKSSLMQLVPHAMRTDPSVGHFFMEDWEVLDLTNNPYFALAEDAGKTGPDVINDEVGGWLKHFCDGDDEDESYLATINEVFKVQANKYLFWEARVRLTEGNTNTANFVVGLAEGVAAGFMQDAGAGPPANYDGIVWYKPDGTMSLSFETSLATAQVAQAGLVTHVSGQVYKLGAMVVPATATTVTIYPWYCDETNGTTVLGTTGNTLTVTGHGEMQAFWGVKNGATSAEEYIEIDYMWVCQER